MTPMLIYFHVKNFFRFVNSPARYIFAPFEVAIPAVKRVRKNDCQAVSNSPFFIFLPQIYNAIKRNIIDTIKWSGTIDGMRICPKEKRSKVRRVESNCLISITSRKMR